MDKLDAIALAYLRGNDFRPQFVEVGDEDVRRFVKLSGNPNRFLPKMFEDDWEVYGFHPNPGTVRVLRVVVDTSGVARLIARQGRGLYVYSFIDPDLS